MSAVIDDNWIETKSEGPNRTSWKVILSGKIMHSGKFEGADPSGSDAYQAGLDWAQSHCVGIAFHWRHQTYSEPVQTETATSQDDKARGFKNSSPDDV